MAKVRDVISALEQAGWRLIRQEGSHRIFKHPTRRGIVVVAGKPSATVRPGTLGAIRRQAGLGREELP